MYLKYPSKNPDQRFHSLSTTSVLLKRVICAVQCLAAHLQGGLDALHTLAATEVAEEGVLDTIVDDRGCHTPRC